MVVCLVETWWTCPTSSAGIGSRHFVATSTPPPPSPPQMPTAPGPKHRGLLLLANQAARQHLRVLATSKTHVVVDVLGARVAFLYHPPSMSADDVAADLAAINPSRVQHLLSDNGRMDVAIPLAGNSACVPHAPAAVPQVRALATSAEGRPGATGQLLVMYHNCRGLSTRQLRAQEALLDGHDGPALVCLAETWWTLTTTSEALTSDHCVVTSTPPPARCPTTPGRQHGGLLLLANAAGRALLRVTSISRHHIAVHAAGRHFAMVYHPPSLPVDAVAADLALLDDSGITHLLGDLNVRWGKATGDTTATAPERRRAYLGWAQAQRMCLVPQQAGTVLSRTDHLFSRDGRTQWAYEPSCSLDSDHGTMRLMLPCDASHFPHAGPHRPEAGGEESGASPFRINNEAILLPARRQALHVLWATECAQPLLRLAQKLKATLHPEGTPPEPEAAAALVEGAWQVWTRTIHDLAVECLGAHDASGRARRAAAAAPAQRRQKNQGAGDQRGTGPRAAAASDPPTKAAEATRAYKGAMSSLSPTPYLLPRDPCKSAGEEAYNHYKSIFTQTPAFSPACILPGDAALPAPAERMPWAECEGAMSTAAVAQAIRAYPAGRAGGPDAIHIRLLQALTNEDTFSESLAGLMQASAHVGYTPRAWNHATLFLLPKDASTPHADKTRPISLTQVTRRIFEKLLLRSWAGPWTELHPAQGGFRPGYSTHSHALVADANTRLRRRGTQGHDVFLDIKGAFDRVPFHRLLRALKTRGCPPAAMSLVYSLMMRAPSATIICNGEVHATALVKECGILQGSILSPFLFNIFIDDLAQVANQGVAPGEPPLLLLFCDDLLIQASDAATAAHTLAQAEAWASANGMTFGHTKCAYHAPGPATTPPLLLDGQPLKRMPPGEHYAYLGLPYSRAGIDWRAGALQRQRAAAAMLDALRTPSLAWPPAVRLAVWRTYIRPVGEYGLAQGWMAAMEAPKEPASLQLLATTAATHRAAVTWVLDTESGQHVCEMLTGSGTWERRCRELLASLSRHATQLAGENPARAINQWRNMTGWHVICPPVNLLPAIIRRPDPLLRRYAALLELPGPHPSWKAYLRAGRAQDVLRQRSATLAHYILPHHPAPKADRTMRIEDPRLRQAALDWRLNRTCIGRWCPCCDAPLTRRHVGECQIIPLDDAYALEHAPTHAAHSWAIQQRAAASGLTAWPRHYTVLDMALNLGHFAHFLRLHDLIVGACEREGRRRAPAPRAQPNSQGTHTL